jgi:ribosomal protein L37AE/L43A
MVKKTKYKPTIIKPSKQHAQAMAAGAKVYKCVNCGNQYFGKDIGNGVPKCPKCGGCPVN